MKKNKNKKIIEIIYNSIVELKLIILLYGFIVLFFLYQASYINKDNKHNINLYLPKNCKELINFGREKSYCWIAYKDISNRYIIVEYNVDDGKTINEIFFLRR